jgi:hypothetical protein
MQAVKMRGLKKADFEVDFFFMDEVELFQAAMKPQSHVGILGEIQEECQ